MYEIISDPPIQEVHTYKFSCLENAREEAEKNALKYKCDVTVVKEVSKFEWRLVENEI